MTYPFELQVIIYRRPFLRDDNLNTEMYMGMGVLERLFDKMEVDPLCKDVYLSFPERWLNIVEQRQLLDRLQKYCPNLESATIKTHSVYIIQCTPNTCCAIVDDDIRSIDDHALDQHLYTRNANNLFDLSGMNVVGAEGVLQVPSKPEGATDGG